MKVGPSCCRRSCLSVWLSAIQICALSEVLYLQEIHHSLALSIEATSDFEVTRYVAWHRGTLSLD